MIIGIQQIYVEFICRISDSQGRRHLLARISFEAFTQVVCFGDR